MLRLIVTLVAALAAVSFPIYLVIWFVRLLLLCIFGPVIWFGVMLCRKVHAWKRRRTRKLLVCKGR